MIPGFFATTNKNLVQSNSSYSFGNALQFDGVNDYVSYNYLSGIKTFNCWFYTPAVRSALPFFGDTVTNKYGLTWINNSILYIIANGSYDTTMNIGLTPINQWVMLTVVYVQLSASAMRVDVYINGLFVKSTVTLALNTITSNVLGNETVLRPSTFYNAKMDEVAFWSSELTSSQISDLYNSGAGDYATNYNNSSLIKYYRMDETNGLVAIDSSGNGADGTLVNFPTNNSQWVAH